MEGKTPTDKVHYVANLVATLTEQVKALDAETKRQGNEALQSVQTIADLRSAVVRLEEQVGELQKMKGEVGSLATVKVDIAVIKRDVEKLEKVKEEWGRRFWAMLGPVVGAAIGWALGYFSR